MLLGVPLFSEALLADLLVLPPEPVELPGAINPNANTDIALIWNPLTESADFQVSGQGLLSNRDLVTSVTISLMTNRLAEPTDQLPVPNSTDRKGWWGDTYLVTDPNAGGIIGSRLWLLARTTSTPQLLITAKGYVTEALGWLLMRKIASSLDVNTFFIADNPQLLGITINISRQSQPPIQLTYQYAWQQIILA